MGEEEQKVAPIEPMAFLMLLRGPLYMVSDAYVTDSLAREKYASKRNKKLIQPDS